MIDVKAITELHRATAERWHREEVDNPYTGFLELVCEQHRRNFLLWHQEDIARSPDAGDAILAQVKRTIDKLNQEWGSSYKSFDDVEMMSNWQALDRAATGNVSPSTPTTRLPNRRRISAMARSASSSA